MIYGLILGAALLYGWERFDIPAWWAWLNGQTEYAVKSTDGYSVGHKNAAKKD
jgi:hypothetical protein